MKYIRISSWYKKGLYTIYYKTTTPSTISFIHESDKTYTDKGLEETPTEN